MNSNNVIRTRSFASIAPYIGNLWSCTSCMAAIQNGFGEGISGIAGMWEAFARKWPPPQLLKGNENRMSTEWITYYDLLWQNMAKQEYTHPEGSSSLTAEYAAGNYWSSRTDMWKYPEFPLQHTFTVHKRNRTPLTCHMVQMNYKFLAQKRLCTSAKSRILIENLQVFMHTCVFKNFKMDYFINNFNKSFRLQWKTPELSPPGASSPSGLQTHGYISIYSVNYQPFTTMTTKNRCFINRSSSTADPRFERLLQSPFQTAVVCNDIKTTTHVQKDYEISSTSSSKHPEWRKSM